MAGFWDFFGGMAKEGARDLRETHEANEKLKRELSFQERLLELQDELEQRREKRKVVERVREKGEDSKWYVVPRNAWGEVVGGPQLASTQEAQAAEEDALMSKTRINKAEYEVGRGRELAESALNAQITSSKASAAASYQNIAADRERISDADRAERESFEQLVSGAEADLMDMAAGNLIPGVRDQDSARELKTLREARHILDDPNASKADKEEARQELLRVTAKAKARRANQGVTARDREQFKDSRGYGGMPGAFEQAINSDGYNPRRQQE